MSEETEGQESDAAAGGISVDPATVSLALGASRAKADAFLDEQIAVLRLEREKRAKEDAAADAEIALNLSHLRFRRISDHARVALEAAGFLVVLLLVCGLGTMVWSATQDRDLVVDAFSVPPDVAQSGLTGSVLAAKVLDRFGAMDRDVHSFTQDFSGVHGASEDVRVEIPDTGISLGEVNRYLRAWLGRETHVTGELVRFGSKISLTVRCGDQPGLGATAAAGDLDGLIQKGAENLFRATQPLRFADYLSGRGRTAEAQAIAEQEAHTGDAHHRAAANISLAFNAFWRGDFHAIARGGEDAVRLDPKNVAGWFIVAAGADDFVHDEQQWRADMAALPLAKSGASTADASELALNLPKEFEADRKALQGDWTGSVETCRSAQGKMAGSCADGNLIASLALAHDLKEARALDGDVPATLARGNAYMDATIARTQIALSAGDWYRAVLLSDTVEAATAKDTSTYPNRDRFLRPLTAEALARDGDIARAKALTANMPQDCDACMRARGRVAMLAHDWAEAARWFALVSARSPDIPYADSDWGAMLLAKGDTDAAIKKFESAHAKGPHFAEPLEMWGEALVLQNRSDLALAKFEEADKCAPNWGRLHLKWGQALYYAGRRDEARKQLGISAGLDLSASDRAALAKWMTQRG